MPDGALDAADVLRIFVAAAAITVLPGLAWVNVFWPPGADIGRTERYAWVAGLSYLFVGTIAIALARFGLLRFEPLLIALAAVTIAGAVGTTIVLRRHRASPWAGRPALSTAAFAIIAVGLPAIVLIAPQVLAVYPHGYPIGSITWYYWGLTTSIVDSGAIPATSVEWGGVYPYQGDYVLFSAYTATLPILAGRASDFALMELLRLLGLGWAILAGLAAFRRFLPRWGAIVGVLLVLGSVHIASKYAGYRPESFNYALMFVALWAVDRFRERMTITRAIPIVVTIVALWIGHGVVLVIAGILAGSVVAGHWLVGRRPTWRELGGFALVGVVGVVASTVADFAAQGKVLLVANALDPARIQGGGTSDLTWQFLQWALGAGRLLAGNPGDAEELWSDRILAPWTIMSGALRWPIVLSAFLPILLWRWLPSRSRALYLGGWIFLLGLAIVVGAFLVLYDTYVPQRVGFGRLAPFTLVAAALLVTVGWTAVALAAGPLVATVRDLVARRLQGPSRPLGRPTGAMVQSVAWAAVLAAAIVVANRSVVGGINPHVGDSLSTDGLATLTWIRDNTPPDALILANSYTEGAIGTLGHRNGYLDGRAPYNKEFDFLLASVDQLRLGRSFYAGETDVQGLRDEGIDYVVVSPQKFGLANPMPFCDPEAEQDRDLLCFAVDPGARDGLTEVARFGSIVVYRVEP